MKLYIRAAVINRAFAPEWRWIVWLDENPPERHWRDRCMMPSMTAIHVGVFDDWPTACLRGRIAYRAANVRWRTVKGQLEVIHQP